MTHKEPTLTDEHAGKLDALVDLRNLAEERLTHLRGFDSLDEPPSERCLADLEVVLYAYLRAVASMPPRVLARHRGFTVAEVDLLEEHVAPLEHLVAEALPNLEREDVPRAVRGEYELESSSTLERFRSYVDDLDPSAPDEDVQGARERAYRNVKAASRDTTPEELLKSLCRKEEVARKKDRENDSRELSHAGRPDVRATVYGELVLVLESIMGEEGSA